jgi:preprotein translocase subunit SecB
MAENKAPNGGAANTGDSANQPQVSVVGQYIKDLSFEAPEAHRFLRGPGNNPNLQLNFNVQVNKLEGDVYEVALSLEGEAKSDEGMLYKLELVYAGALMVRNVPQEAYQPILFIQAPAMLFPFARRIAADLTREGGFPPLLLDPIDFAGLYQRRLETGQQPTIGA